MPIIVGREGGAGVASNALATLAAQAQQQKDQQQQFMLRGIAIGAEAAQRRYESDRRQQEGDTERNLRQQIFDQQKDYQRQRDELENARYREQEAQRNEDRKADNARADEALQMQRENFKANQADRKVYRDIQKKDAQTRRVSAIGQTISRAGDAFNKSTRAIADYQKQAQSAEAKKQSVEQMLAYVDNEFTDPVTEQPIRDDAYYAARTAALQGNAAEFFKIAKRGPSAARLGGQTYQALPPSSQTFYGMALTDPASAVRIAQQPEIDQQTGKPMRPFTQKPAMDDKGKPVPGKMVDAPDMNAPPVPSAEASQMLNAVQAAMNDPAFTSGPEGYSKLRAWRDAYARAENGGGPITAAIDQRLTQVAAARAQNIVPRVFQEAVQHADALTLSAGPPTERGMLSGEYFKTLAQTLKTVATANGVTPDELEPMFKAELARRRMGVLGSIPQQPAQPQGRP